MVNFGEGSQFFRSPKESHRNSTPSIPGPDHNNRQGRLPQDRPRSAPLGNSQGGGGGFWVRWGCSGYREKMDSAVAKGIL